MNSRSCRRQRCGNRGGCEAADESRRDNLPKAEHLRSKSVLGSGFFKRRIEIKKELSELEDVAGANRTYPGQIGGQIWH